MNYSKRTKNLLPSDFDLDLIMAYRCAYYCHGRSLIPDEDYDREEKEYAMVNGPLPNIGSDKKMDYTPAQRALCMYFLFSNRYVSKSPTSML
jgi:hypothetical protein